MQDLRRKLLSQNFLHSRTLCKRLVDSSSIGKNDLVLEIGPGKGIITEHLLEKSQHVLAIELDAGWYTYLQSKFATYLNLTLYNKDFLEYDLPALPYKVFANIPFAIEGKIIRKLIDATNSPEDAYVVVMKELAIRLEAKHKENLFSVMHKPWWDFSIPYYFHPTDFTPVPDVDAVLFRFNKKQRPLLPLVEKDKYQKFVERGFGHGQAVRQNLIKFYSRPEVERILQNYSIRNNAKPSELSLDQWIKIYSHLLWKCQ